MDGKFDQELPVKITSSRTENNVLISFPTEKKGLETNKQTNKESVKRRITMRPPLLNAKAYKACSIVHRLSVAMLNFFLGCE